MIPFVATITVGRDSTYWIPLALAWLLLLPLAVLAAPFVIVACWIARVDPWRAIATVWQILTAAKGSEFAFEVNGRSIEISIP